jgi:hypothetical protein
VGPRWNLEAERTCFFSPGAFNTFDNLGAGKPSVSYPIINVWGGTWVVPDQMRMVPEPERGQSEMQLFFYES